MRRIIISFCLLGLVACGETKAPVVLDTKDSKDTKDVPGYHQKVIYGDDNRLDYYQASPTLRSLADSTVALVKNRDLSSVGGGKVSISTESYALSYGLCKTEPFYNQEIGAFCSGSLVGEDLILTAGHCIKSQSDCSNTSFVFGFRMDSVDGIRSTVDADDVYECGSVVHSVVDGAGVDFAVLKLKRKVVGRSPLPIKRDRGMSVAESIFVVGHPSGLPTKIAGGANVRSVKDSSYFVANLDTYGGNSGSAVFNEEEGKIVGILVRGETDYKYSGSCTVSNVCKDDSCRGEDVTIVGNALEYIPELIAEEPVEEVPGVGIYEVEVSKQIPDFKASGLSSEIEVQDARTISKLQVAVDISHSWIGDLKVHLISPTGVELRLHNRSGGSANDIQGVYGLNLKSVDSLSRLLGSEAKGIWKLKVSDHAKRDVGVLHSWGMSIE